MFKAGGRSYNNGITFFSDKFKISFKNNGNNTTMVLQKNENETTTKILNFLNKIPIIRTIVGIIRNMKVILILYCTSLVIEIMMKSEVETIQNIAYISIYIYEVIVLLILTFSIYKIKGKRNYGTLTKQNSSNTFSYHEAEHKVLYVHTKNQKMTLENCRKAPRVSDKCGSMLAIIFICVLILFRFFIYIFTIDIYYSLADLLCLIISYELFLMKSNTPILKYIFKIGYWFQENIVTREPSDLQLIEAMKAFNLLKMAETGQFPEDKLAQGKKLSFVYKI